MPTTIPPQATFSAVRNAFNTEGYGISSSFFAYRRTNGGTIVPDAPAFSGIGAGTVGSPLQLSQFNGFTVPTLTPTVIFTPEGGTTVGTAVFVNSDVAYEEAEVIIDCTVNATWTYTRTFTSGNGTEFVSLSSGGVGTSIIFRCDGEFGIIARRTWSLSATAGGITQYWTVDLRSEYV
jgi:hypothetical protein